MRRALDRLPAMLGMGRDLLRGAYPSCVYGRRPPPGELPAIFTFHATTAEVLEPVLAGLARGGYRSLTCDEYLSAVRGETSVDPTRSVLLTFDDGDASVWSVVQPLLERYEMRAVVYLIPGRIQERPLGDPGDEPLCTWPQIVEMHERGRIDFQSHTLLHQRVFTDTRLGDFVRPELVARAHPHDLLLWDGPDPSGTSLPVRPSYPSPPLGAPLYGSEPRMVAERAVHENPEVHRACLSFVEERGGAQFFQESNWRGLLDGVASGAGAGASVPTAESREERDTALRADLERARGMIEQKLGGKRVRHLAWPWGVASDAAVRAATDAGYEACYWGRSTGGFTNFAGGDPMRLARIGEDFLSRLPELGGVPLGRILLEKLRRRTPSTAPAPPVSRS